MLPQAAPILIEHLKSNRTASDAMLAAPALFGFGPAVAEWLGPCLDSADYQERDLARLILLDLAGPPATAKDRAERRALNRVTSTAEDPVLVHWSEAVGRSTRW